MGLFHVSKRAFPIQFWNINIASGKQRGARFCCQTKWELRLFLLLPLLQNPTLVGRRNFQMTSACPFGTRSVCNWGEGLEGGADRFNRRWEQSYLLCPNLKLLHNSVRTVRSILTLQHLTPGYLGISYCKIKWFNQSRRNLFNAQRLALPFSPPLCPVLIILISQMSWMEKS